MYKKKKKKDETFQNYEPYEHDDPNIWSRVQLGQYRIQVYCLTCSCLSLTGIGIGIPIVVFNCTWVWTLKESVIGEYEL